MARPDNARHVATYRRRVKEQLVAHKGGRCHDCGLEGPPFLFDFDHRDPTQKSFGLGSSKTTRAKAIYFAEADKCDLVCANCHRWRTHRQRCPGCSHCTPSDPA